jgi:hypothetical protein
VMGSWDLVVLSELLGDASLELKVDTLGFEAMALEAMFSGEGLVLDSMFDTANAPASVQAATADLLEAHPSTSSEIQDEEEMIDEQLAAEEANQAAAQADYEKRKQAVLDAKIKMKEAVLGDAQDTDFLIHILCRDRKSKNRLLELTGPHADSRYVDGTPILEALERLAASKAPKADAAAE